VPGECPSSIWAPAIRQYLDRNADTPTAANRRIQFLKAAYARDHYKRKPDEVDATR